MSKTIVVQGRACVVPYPQATELIMAHTKKNGAEMTKRQALRMISKETYSMKLWYNYDVVECFLDSCTFIYYANAVKLKLENRANPHK